MTGHGWRYAVRRDPTTHTWHVHARHTSGVEQRAEFPNFERATLACRLITSGQADWTWLTHVETLTEATAAA